MNKAPCCNNLFSYNESRVEKYKIFHDVNINSLIGGDEILENKWDKVQISRWLFFYRPWYSRLRQYDQIRNKQAVCQNVLEKIRWAESFQTFTILLFILLWGIYLYDYQSFLASLNVLLFGLFLVGLEFLYIFVQKQNVIRISNSIVCLEEEIRLLSAQLPEPRTREDMDCDIKIFQKENLLSAIDNFKKIEEGDIFVKSKETGRDRSITSVEGNPKRNCAMDFSDNVFILDGWAGQQHFGSSRNDGSPTSLFPEKMLDGFKKEDLFKLWSWRIGKANRSPIYRFPFYQMLVISDQGLISYGFYADLVPAKDVSDEKAELFHYRHISNISRTDVTYHAKAEGYGEVPKLIRNSVFETKSDKVSCYVTSGQQFSCTFMSTQTKDLLNKLIIEQNNSRQDDPEPESVNIYNMRDELDSVAKDFMRRVNGKISR